LPNALLLGTGLSNTLLSSQETSTRRRSASVRKLRIRGNSPTLPDRFHFVNGTLSR
jgi:hypothetical protein